MDDPDCSSSLHQLYHFLDDELTDENRATIRAHLEGCPPCFEAFDFEAELRQVIASKCIERAPDTLKQRIAEQLAREGLPGH